MVQINDQVAALGKSQLDAAIRGAEVAVDALGRLTELQLESARTACAEGSLALRQWAAVKEPAQFAALANSPAQPAWDRTSAYARSVYEIISAAQGELTALLERHVAEVNRNVVLALDTATKAAPAGSESAVRALRSAIQSGNTWYETAMKAARQMTAAAEAGLASAAAPAAATRRKAA